MMLSRQAQRQGGGLMIEVLVTIAIVVIGLWGLMEVQSRLQKSEMESYQRTQALILVEDMANRIDTNRNNADAYLTGGTPLGTGATCPTATTSLQVIDSGEWCSALLGAAETQSAANVGAMVGARGCVTDAGTGQYMVTVVWQGLTPLSAPPVEITCGVDLYDEPAGSGCVNNLCRRYVTTMVRIADLLDPP